MSWTSLPKLTQLEQIRSIRRLQNRLLWFKTKNYSFKLMKICNLARKQYKYRDSALKTKKKKLRILIVKNPLVKGPCQLRFKKCNLFIHLRTRQFFPILRIRKPCCTRLNRIKRINHLRNMKLSRLDSWILKSQTIINQIKNQHNIYQSLSKLTKIK